MPDKTLPQPREDAVCGHHQVRRILSPVVQHDGTFLGAKPHVIDSRAAQDGGAQLDGAVEQTLVQVCAVEVPKRKAVLCGVLVEVHGGDDVAFPADHVEAFRQRCVAEELLAHAPSDKQAGSVRENLDTSADFANGGGGFKDGDRVAGEGERDSSGEATETGTRDDDLQCVSLEF